jgi:hypothetical protein
MSDKPTEDPREQVLQALRTKSCMKQDIHVRTTELFAEFKEVVEEIANDLAETVKPQDERLVVSFVDRNPTSCELTVAGDIIIFNMHTNVFRLDQSHHLWKTSYLEEDETRGYFGLINMYNFLRDSMRFNRDRDLGYLVARLFLNREGHYFMQGRRQLGFLYSNLQEEVMERAKLKEMLYTVINQVIEFDLLAPPYDQVNPVTVSEIKELYANQQLSTGKRLGFRFQADMDDIA